MKQSSRYSAALVRPGDTQAAQIGLAKAFLKTGKPQLALTPLSKALEESPDDPKVLLLLGVTRDLAGQHREAQAYYRNGLVRAPGDPALTVDLALSLALSGEYPDAIAVLQPLAMAPTSSPQERQTLALIYGLRGNIPEAGRLNRIDLDEAAVEHNLAYYQSLRELTPGSAEPGNLVGRPCQSVMTCRSLLHQCFPIVSMMLMAAGPSSTMNRVGRMKMIIGTVSIAGRRAAFSSARVIRAVRISAARTRRDWASGVPNFAVCVSV